MCYVIAVRGRRAFGGSSTARQGRAPRFGALWGSVDGAWAVLGLCARESARVDRARIAAERGGGNRRTFPYAVNSGGEETHAGGGASKRARTEA